MKQLVFWDWAIIAVYIVGVLCLGLYFSRRQTSLREYFLASGKMPWWAVSISMYATMLSPLSFLGFSGWIFLKDSRWQFGGVILMSLVIYPVAAFLWIPLWGRLRMLSIYEYLEYRFHPAVRAFGAALFPIQMIFWIGNGLVTASQAFEQVVPGVSATQCLIAIVLLGTVYTMLGGSRAVIWTDVLQFFVFLFAYLIMGCVILSYFNWQPGEIYRIASSVQSEVTGYPHTQFISAEFNMAVEATIWAILFVNALEVLGFGSQQVVIQRLLASGGQRNMYKAMFGYIGVNVIWIVLAIVVTWGLVAFYHQNVAARDAIEHPDKVVPHFVVNYLQVVVRGMILAGLLAAMMSSFDSALNSMSSVTINDFYRRYFARNRSEKDYVAASRYCTLGWGVLLLLFALWQKGHSDSTALERVAKLHLLVIGPVLCFFVLGVFTRRATTFGALVGGFVTMAVALSLNGFPGLFEPNIEGYNWMWIEGISVIVGLPTGYVVSLFFPAPPPEKLKGLTVIQLKGE